jgi:hypothetical protein
MKNELGAIAAFLVLAPALGVVIGNNNLAYGQGEGPFPNTNK